MGAVYLGVHQFFTDRRVAIKTILPSQIEGQGDEAVARLIDEGRALESLDHEHVVGVYDLFVQNDCYYLIMEFVSGQPLDAVLKNQPVDLYQALELAIKIGRGIAAAHAKGILHRDIKPQNVMVGEKGEVKVMDFGLAKFADAGTRTRTGFVVGTPRYMSPEQIIAKPLDARSDQYAYGVLVYRLLCGREPFIDGDSMAIVYKHVNEIPPPPVEWNPNIPPEVSSVILKALAKKPEERFASVADMIVELEMAKLKLVEDGLEMSQALSAQAMATGPLPTPSGQRALRGTPAPRPRTPPPHSMAGYTETQPGRGSRTPVPANYYDESLQSLPALTTAAIQQQPAPVFGGRPVRKSRAGRWIAGVLIVAAGLSSAGLWFHSRSRRQNDALMQASGPAAAAPEKAAMSNSSGITNRWIRIEPPPAGITVPLGVGSDDTPKSFAGFRPSRKISAPVKPYEIQQHEVTWGELESWLAAHPDQPLVPAPDWASGSTAARQSYPVSGITWSGAWAYCKSQGGALPTEEQWEFAARGAARRANPWGDGRVDYTRTRVFGGLSATPEPVMTSDQDVTPGGDDAAIHDLLGNVQEWTADLWRENLPGQHEESWVQTADISYRAVRGLPLGVPLPLTPPPEGAAHRVPLCAEGSCVEKFPAARKFVGFRCARFAPPSR